MSMTDDTQPLGEVTKLLHQVRGPDSEAEQRLVELIYAELRRIAEAKLRSERRNHTLSPTALAHDAWMKLRTYDARCENRQHFFAIAAKAMRRILIDHARIRNAAKRGPTSISIEEVSLAAPADDENLIALDEALTRFSATNERAARVIEMHYFGGLTGDQIAEVLGVNRRTVARDLEIARAWLYRAMTGKTGDSGSR